MRRTLTVALSLALISVIASNGCKTVSRALNKSGTMFVVEVVQDGSYAAVSVERSVKVVQSRLNAVGIDGEVDQTGGNRFEVKIFGAADLEKVRRFLFTTYKLELKKVVSPPSPLFQTYPDQEKANAAASEEQQVLPYSEREVNDKPQYVIVEKVPIITGEEIRSAQAVSRTGSESDYQISFTLKRDGAEKFGDWTAKNINNYLAVVLDDKVASVAFIKSQISDAGEISGRFSKAMAEEIALALNSGYMPWKLKVIEEKPF
ncbi:MAG: hypothetical protein ABIR33_17545 [Pyrinomonadaceae bacterium]